TLTEGKPSVRRIVPASGFDENHVLAHAAAAESHSEHPLARAIVDHAAARQVLVPNVQQFESDPGLGVWGVVDGKRVLVGNRRLLERDGVDPGPLASVASRERESGAAAIYAAINGAVAGLLVIADAVKPTTREALRQLEELDVHVVML